MMQMTNEKDLQQKKLDELLSMPTMEIAPTENTPPVPTTKTVTEIADRLTPEEQEKARELAKQIPLDDSTALITYGVNAQKELTTFSHNMLNQVQATDVGPIGDVLNELMVKLSMLDPDELAPQEEKGFFKRIFKKAQQSVREMMTKYEKLGTQVDKISVQLGRAREGLLQDVRQLDQLYEQNKTYFQALNIYIAAAEMKQEEIQQEVLPLLKQKAEASGDQMDMQELNDMGALLDRLEKRTHDLKISRQIAIQSAPQIRMIQQTNQTLAEKIQSSIMTAIPLWKNQIAIALTLQNQQHAVESQKLVTKTTNDLLLKNSEMLKQNTIETAKENERGLVEIETLKVTQQNLIETIEETLDIQAEGRRARKEAEVEIAQMEEQLKERLLNAYNRSEERDL